MALANLAMAGEIRKAVADEVSNSLITGSRFPLRFAIEIDREPYVFAWGGGKSAPPYIVVQVPWAGRKYEVFVYPDSIQVPEGFGGIS